MRLRTTWLSIAALATAFACASDGEDPTPMPEPEPEPEPEPAADAGSLPAPALVREVDCATVQADTEVLIDQLAFMPAQISIAPGDVVMWMNEDIHTHTVTSGNPGDSDAGALFDIDSLTPGDMVCLEFGEIGSFEYYCELHPVEMSNGLVVVE